jgi:hypothetical protein
MLAGWLGPWCDAGQHFWSTWLRRREGVVGEAGARTAGGELGARRLGRRGQGPLGVAAPRARLRSRRRPWRRRRGGGGYRGRRRDSFGDDTSEHGRLGFCEEAEELLLAQDIPGPAGDYNARRHVASKSHSEGAATILAMHRHEKMECWVIRRWRSGAYSAIICVQGRRKWNTL